MKARHHDLSKRRAQGECRQCKDDRAHAHAEWPQPRLRPTSGKQQLSGQNRDANAPDNVVAQLPLGQDEIDAEPSSTELGSVDEIRVEECLKRQSFFDEHVSGAEQNNGPPTGGAPSHEFTNEQYPAPVERRDEDEPTDLRQPRCAQQHFRNQRRHEEQHERRQGRGFWCWLL